MAATIEHKIFLYAPLPELATQGNCTRLGLASSIASQKQCWRGLLERHRMWLGRLQPDEAFVTTRWKVLYTK